MNLFIDMEFSGLQQNTTPISLGIIAENGRSFYCEFTDFDPLQINDWINENVLCNLISYNPLQAHWPQDIYYRRGSRDEMRLQLTSWLSQFGQITFWADVPHYDWVLFCSIFGGAQNLPSNVHYICRDLATLLEAKGYDPDTNRRSFIPVEQEKFLMHNAYDDAVITKLVYEALMACWEKDHDAPGSGESNSARATV